MKCTQYDMHPVSCDTTHILCCGSWLQAVLGRPVPRLSAAQGATQGVNNRVLTSWFCQDLLQKRCSWRKTYPQVSLLDLGILQVGSLCAEQLNLLSQLCSLCLLALPADPGMFVMFNTTFHEEKLNTWVTLSKMLKLLLHSQRVWGLAGIELASLQLVEHAPSHSSYQDEEDSEQDKSKIQKSCQCASVISSAINTCPLNCLQCCKGRLGSSWT